MILDGISKHVNDTEQFLANTGIVLAAAECCQFKRPGEMGHGLAPATRDEYCGNERTSLQEV